MACGRLIRHLITSKTSFTCARSRVGVAPVCDADGDGANVCSYLHVHAEADGSGSVPCRCSVVDLSRMEVAIYLSTSYL